MVALSDHDQRRPGLRGLAGHVVDPLNEGAGGVDDLAMPRLQGLIGRASDAVGAYDHPGTVGDLIGPFNAVYADLSQRSHHLRVVDDWPKGHGWSRSLGGLHGPAHAKAEPRMVCQNHVRDG